MNAFVITYKNIHNYDEEEEPQNFNDLAEDYDLKQFRRERRSKEGVDEDSEEDLDARFFTIEDIALFEKEYDELFNGSLAVE